MISKNQLKILNSIKIYLEDRDKTLLDDYITFHNILMSMYARHLFRRNANWTKINLSYNVNYRYIRENQTNYKFTELEKKLKNYIHMFNDHIEIKLNIKDFIDHIRYSMKEYITNISVPFNIMSPKIREIKEKYKDNDYVMNYKKKSSKINYEVLNNLF